MSERKGYSENESNGDGEIAYFVKKRRGRLRGWHVGWLWDSFAVRLQGRLLGLVFGLLLDFHCHSLPHWQQSIAWPVRYAPADMCQVPRKT